MLHLYLIIDIENHSKSEQVCGMFVLIGSGSVGLYVLIVIKV